MVGKFKHKQPIFRQLCNVKSDKIILLLSQRYIQIWDRYWRVILYEGSSPGFIFEDLLEEKSAITL